MSPECVEVSELEVIENLEVFGCARRAAEHEDILNHRLVGHGDGLGREVSGRQPWQEGAYRFTAGPHVVIAQGRVQGAHVGRCDLSEDEGGEGAAVSEDEATVINIVPAEVFLPFQVGKKGLVEC